MLPRLLCERLCSLNPNVDRLAYSVFFRMDRRTGKLDTSFEPVFRRTVIRTCAKWNYDLVQAILDKKVTKLDDIEPEFRPKGGHSFADMVSDCFRMNEIAQQRRKRRLENGSVMFCNREFTFKLDTETKYPLDYKEYERMESKQLVEEYMLMANILVGEYLFKYCKDKTLLRAHNDITEDKKEKLAVFLERIGIKKFDLSCAKSLSHSMERLKSMESDETLEVINRKFLTCLTMAKYVTVDDKDPSQYMHYGLNFPIYTHFTSPIRRYADLLVHRLLTISLKEQHRTRDLIEGIDYARFAELCSEKSYNARRAGKECQKLFHCLLLKQQGAQVFESLIFDVESQAISVYIHEINIHHVIRLKEDPRVESTTYYETDDTLRVACSFRKDLELAPGSKKYQDRVSKELSAGVNPNNICFEVYDKVKIMVETTTEFPLDLKCTLLIT